MSFHSRSALSTNSVSATAPWGVEDSESDAALRKRPVAGHHASLCVLRVGAVRRQAKTALRSDASALLHVRGTLASCFAARCVRGAVVKSGPKILPWVCSHGCLAALRTHARTSSLGRGALLTVL